MGDFTHIQTDFTLGELSPKLFGRSDLDQYAKGVAVQENFITQKHGGVIRRSGTRYVAEVKDSTTLARLIPFQFSVSQTYILEFGNLYIRIYRNEGQLSNGGTPTTITAPWADTDVRALKFTQSADVLYVCHPDYEPRKLSRKAGDDSLVATWTLQTLDMGNGPYLDVNDTTTTLSPDATTGTGVTITASSTTGINDDDGFKSTDVDRLIRISNPASGEKWGWCRITAFTDTTHVTVTVRGDFPTTNASTDWALGAWSGTTGWPRTVTLHQERSWFGATADEPQKIWASRIISFRDFAPSANSGVVRAIDALNFAISSDQVNAVRWLHSDALGLLILTEDGEYLGHSRGAIEPIDPTNFAVTRQSNYTAAETVQPFLVGNALLFVTGSTRRVRELVFKQSEARFAANDMTVLSEHVTLGGIVDSAYQKEPDNVLWLARNDGVLLGFSYDRAEKVTAWHRHIIGGSLSGESNAAVEAVAVIRESNVDQLWMVVKRTIGGSTKRYVEFMEVQYDSDTLQEDAFFVDSGLTLDDSKTVTGATQANPVVITSASHGFSDGDKVRVRSVKGMTELNGRTFTVDLATTNTFALQGEDGRSHTAYVSGGNVAKEVTVITGLGHLEGETVAVLADGGSHPTRVVTNGQITLQNAASRAQVGLPFTARVHTLPLVFQTAGLDSRGRRKRVNRSFLMFDNTVGGKYGSDPSSLDAVDSRAATDAMDAAPPLFAGIKELSFPGSHQRRAQVYVVQDEPLPMTILSIMSEVVVGEL